MSIINSNEANFHIIYKIVYEGVYHYKIPLRIKANNYTSYIGKMAYVCENKFGYGFGISNENSFDPEYYDRDSCRYLLIE